MSLTGLRRDFNLQITALQESGRNLSVLQLELDCQRIASLSMDATPRDLIPAIVSYVTHKGGYVTKTKLLKLLYLCDVEYYRVFRNLLTGFQWKFFHLGPWAREFDPLLNELLTHGVLIESSSSRPDYDTKFFKTSEDFDLTRLFGTFKEEVPVKRVLERWAESSTGEILDYVYFRTEPMEHGIRNEPLDFTTISEQPLLNYARQASGKTPQEIKTARKKLLEQLSRRRGEAAKAFAFTSPRYDEEFLEALEKLDGTTTA
jgi:hypothetical protein